MPSYDFKSSKAFVNVFDIKPYQSGKLSGLTFAVKDVIDVAEYVTGFGNPTWAKTHSKAVVHAMCVEQLLLEGATCLGKTLTGEMAFDFIGENFHYGTPINPKAPDRVPGGSSNGSASAVACGLVDFALGTDTGGSVRVPASYCGIWGYRPSHDRISVAGVNAFGPTFDTVGVLAKNSEILVKAANVLLGTDNTELSKPAKNIYLLEDLLAICDDEVQIAFNNSLKNLGQKLSIKKITLSEIIKQEINHQQIFELFCLLQWTEIWSTLGSWVEQHNPEFGPSVTKNFELARTADRTKIQNSIRARELFAAQINNFLGEENLLLLPTAPTLAPKPGSVSLDRRVGNFYSRLIGFTAIANLGRLPQVTMPLAAVNDIPVGISLIAARGNDECLLSTSSQV